MAYTCIKCLADTDNDCDICDDCAAETSYEDGVDDQPKPWHPDLRDLEEEPVSPVTNGERK